MRFQSYARVTEALIHWDDNNESRESFQQPTTEGKWCCKGQGLHWKAESIQWIFSTPLTQLLHSVSGLLSEINSYLQVITMTLLAILIHISPEQVYPELCTCYVWYAIPHNLLFIHHTCLPTPRRRRTTFEYYDGIQTDRPSERQTRTWLDGKIFHISWSESSSSRRSPFHAIYFLEGMAHPPTPRIFFVQVCSNVVFRFSAIFSGTTFITVNLI